VFIYLIRHPEVINNQITRDGYLQIKSLLQKYELTKFDKIFSSTLERAKIAAIALSLNQKQIPIYTDALCEIKPTITGNLRRKDTIRLKKVREQFSKSSVKKIAVVCHGNVIRWFISQELGTPFKKSLKLDIYPCSTSLLVRTKNKGKVLFVNSYQYLPKSIRSDYYYGRRTLSAKSKISR